MFTGLATPDSQVTELSRTEIDPTGLQTHLLIDQLPAEFDFAGHIKWAHDAMGTNAAIDDSVERTDLSRISSVPGGFRGENHLVPHVGYDTRAPDSARTPIVSRNLGNGLFYTELQTVNSLLLRHPRVSGHEDLTDGNLYRALGIFSSIGSLAVFGKTTEGLVVPLLVGNPSASQRLGWGLFQGITDIHQHVI